MSFLNLISLLRNATFQGILAVVSIVLTLIASAFAESLRDISLVLLGCSILGLLYIVLPTRLLLMMMRVGGFYSIGFISALLIGNPLALINNDDADVSIRNTHAPRFTKWKTEPSELARGQIGFISVEAKDDDSLSQLCYIFKAEHGRITPGCGAAIVTYEAPNEPGIYKITMIVTDGKHQTSQDITVVVR